jgi:hypothetical protein
MYAVPMGKLLRRTVFLIMVAIVCAWLCAWIYMPSQSVRDRETYAALSSFLSRGLTGDSHDFGSQERLVVILDHTSNGFMRLLWANRLHSISRTERFMMLLESLHSSRFERKFAIPAPYKLVSSTEPPGYSETDQLASYGMMTFSHVTFNHNATRASFYMEHLCGLCGEGSFVVMEKKNGIWQIIDGAGTWIS